MRISSDEPTMRMIVFQHDCHSCPVVILGTSYGWPRQDSPRLKKMRFRVSSQLNSPPSPGCVPSADTRLPAFAFMLFLIAVACASSAVLIHDGRTSALVTAMLIAAAIFALERWESGRAAPGRIAAIVRASPVGTAWLIVCIVLPVLAPTFKTWFVSDDYGCLVAFHRLSFAGFLRMFHTDLSTLVEGEAGQEIRPFYALFYFVNYRLWGMNPFGYHLCAICAHLVNALLLFLIARRFAPASLLRSAFASLLFALQPASSMAVSWVAGAPAEVFPTMFYLAAFLLFMQFRTTGMRRYLAVSVAAFVACLCSKEVAVTLPVMLASYDALERYLSRGSSVTRGAVPARATILQLFPAYVPFAFLLVLYLAWRHIVFSHVLAENYWAETLGLDSSQGGTGFYYFAHQVFHLGRSLASQFAFTLRVLLLPFSSIATGIALGMYLVWALSIFFRRSQAWRDLCLILYFGAVWFFIAYAPLLAAAREARHLYLPVVGPCIAIAFCAYPMCGEFGKANCVRIASSAILIVLAALQVSKENDAFKMMASLSEYEKKQLAAEVGATPTEALLVVQYPAEEVLPFPLEPPFAPATLLHSHSLIAPPQAYGWTLSTWWENALRILRTPLADPSSRSIEIDLLIWDEPTRSYRRARRVLPKELLTSSIEAVLGSQVNTDRLTLAQGNALVRTLTRLVLNGSDATQTRTETVARDGGDATSA